MRFIARKLVFGLLTVILSGSFFTRIVFADDESKTVPAGSWTVGVTHRFNDLVSVRPEVRYEYAFSARPWDNGTRKGQLMFAMDALMRF